MSYTSAAFAPSLAQVNHFITPEGVWRLPNAIFLGTCAQVGSALLAEASTRYNNVGTLPSSGDPYSIVTSGGLVYVGVRLRSLRFDTHFQVNTAGVAIPVFSPGRGTIRLNLTWDVPDDADILLGVCVVPPTPTEHRWKFSKAYFAMTKPDVGGFFNPPLPNIYDDGSVCLGVNDHEPVFHENLAGLVDVITARFNNAPWNTDLLQGRSAGSVFSFRLAEGGVAAAIHHPAWEQSCRRVSHPAFAKCVLPPRRPSTALPPPPAAAAASPLI